MNMSYVRIRLIVALLQLPMTAWAARSVPVIPTNGTAVKVVVGEKERTYYRLTPKSPLRVDIDGPGKLVAQTRLLFPTGSGWTERYSIIVRENGRHLKIHTTQTERSRASIKSGETLGRIRKTTLKIPPGTHTYEFGLENGESALTRFSFTAEKGNRGLVSLEALSYHKVVTAFVKEKLITYYVSSKDQSVQLRVIGPTRLKVTTRLNYNANMKGAQRYGLGVWEGGKQSMLKALATTKSVGMEYQEWKDVVPGKANSFYLTVPSGEHQYTFQLEGGLAKYISLRFSIPKSDLQNEE